MSDMRNSDSVCIFHGHTFTHTHPHTHKHIQSYTHMNEDTRTHKKLKYKSNFAVWTSLELCQFYSVMAVFRKKKVSMI